MNEINRAFVAYPSRDIHLVQLISQGVAKANRIQKKIRYEPWEFNDIAGIPLISPIIEGIDVSSYVVADITYLNPNVIYEVGFAIGRQRRCFLIRHKNTEGDRRSAREAGIFDTLGYEEYYDEDDLVSSLSSYVDPTSIPFSLVLDRSAPVYIVEPPEKDEMATVMTSRLKKAKYRYRSFNPTEIARLSATDAIHHVSISSGVLVSILGGDDNKALIHNTRTLFVAGLAHGMKKPTLILAEATVSTPLDVRDVTKYYKRPDDIASHIAGFALEVTEHLQQDSATSLCTPNLLQSLQVGDPTAENEMTTLANYFFHTDQYHRAIRGEVNLVVGRKGAGKTALFIQVRNEIRSDRRNVVVDLKPEGYQLLKLKEDILTYLTDGSSQHLVTAFWEYLILLEVTYKLLENDRNTYKYNHTLRDIYLELERTYKVENFSIEGDFSERLLSLSQRISQDYANRHAATDSKKLTTGQVAELVYTHDIRALRQQVSAYLENKNGVWVLFDNLDKGWSTQGVDDVDAMVLRCLIDAGHKIERDMRKVGHDFHCIVFVRNDVYEHLMSQSTDYGKEMRATLDWTDPEMLREMLRLRLVSSLDTSDEKTAFDQIWPQLSISHYKGEETSSYIIDRSLMRPRNMLKIFSHAKGFASNLGHQKISDQDLENGILAYSQDLLVELDHELTDVFPVAKDLLYHFIDSEPELDIDTLKSLIMSSGIDEHKVMKIIEFLLYYGIVGLKTESEDVRYIYNVNYDLKMLQIRAQRFADKARYVVNPSFRPALGIQETG